MMRAVSANGADIPRLGLGTWPMRGETCVRAVQAALDVGYRHLDTASVYENEREVGEAIAAHAVPRGEVFVTTKVPPSSLRAGALRRSLEKSLRRLRIDHVDMLLVHWPNRAVPIAETLQAMAGAREEGLIRHAGVSNFTVALVEEAVSTGAVPLVTNQVEYHPLLDQTKVLAACRRHGLSLTSYQPVARGAAFGEPVIRDIAAAHGRTPAQVILRWHIEQPGVIAIPKSAEPRRIRENFDIAGFSLSEAEMAAISALARRGGRQVDPATAPDWDKPE